MRYSNIAFLLSAGISAQFVASPAFSDQVINDDLIVTGSECVGFDCVDGEVFGFDTLKLKENNLRIKFDDTSNGGSFPQNDWQIRINDSTNGGASYFAIEDVTGSRTPFRVEAGARDNALFVDSPSGVGIGTSTPAVELEIKDGDTPTVRLNQDGSSGWAPQIWDVAGNETNFFIRDTTNGSRLPFRIRPGALESSLDIASDGDIGMGTPNPLTKLHIVGGDGSIRITDTDANSVDKRGFVVSTHYDATEEELLGIEISARETQNLVSIGGGSNAYNAASVIRFFTADMTDALRGQERMRINENGQLALARTLVDAANIFQVGTNASNGNGAALTKAGVWTNGSSRLNKIDIESLETTMAVKAVLDLHPVTYRGRQESDETYVGFIAEEVPDLVAMNGRKGIAAIEVAAVLTKVIQEHQKTIQEQRTAIENLGTRLAALEAKVATASEEQ